MRPSRRNQEPCRPTWGRWLGAVWGAAAALLGWFGPAGDALDRISFDVPTLCVDSVPADLVLVYFDTETKRQLGEAIDAPLPLRHHARLMERLLAGGARLVLYNVLLDQASPEQAKVLQLQMRALDRVVLVSALHEWQEANYRFESLLRPLPELAEVAAGVGLARLTLDRDLVVRRLDAGSDKIPSAPWVAAGLLRRFSTDRTTPLWLRYHAKPSRYSSYKLEQVVAQDGVPPRYFRDKLVVVGGGPEPGLVGEVRDAFGTPHTEWTGEMASGTLLHAVSLHNLCSGDALRRLGGGVELGGLLVLGALLGYGMAGLRPLRAAGWCLGLAVLGSGLGLGLHWGVGWWFSWMTWSTVQVPAVLVWTIIFQGLCDYRDRAVLMDSLSLHFSPARVRQILRHPERLRPGAEWTEVSLLMTDIQNFSRVTGLLHPDDLVRVLNAYYDRAIECVHRADGTVMDLVGDSLLALWNAPDPQADHCRRACHTALELQGALQEFDRENPRLPLRTRIGLHAGRAWVGNIGGRQRFDFAALGEPVNMVSRLQALNKVLGTEILATREIQRAGEGMVASRLLGHFALSGIDQPVEVYELLGPRSSATENVAWLIDFAEGLHHFQRRDLIRAEHAFASVLATRPVDGPARFYLKQIAAWRGKELPPEWIGVIPAKGRD